MAFADKLPSSYQSLKIQRQNTKQKINQLNRDIDDDDCGYHECDCEYCPVPEKEAFTPKQIEEKEEELKELEPVLDEYDSTILRIERYAKFMNIDLNIKPKKETN